MNQSSWFVNVSCWQQARSIILSTLIYVPRYRYLTLRNNHLGFSLTIWCQMFHCHGFPFLVNSILVIHQLYAFILNCRDYSIISSSAGKGKIVHFGQFCVIQSLCLSIQYPSNNIPSKWHSCCTTTLRSIHRSLDHCTDCTWLQILAAPMYITVLLSSSLLVQCTLLFKIICTLYYTVLPCIEMLGNTFNRFSLLWIPLM